MKDTFTYFGHQEVEYFELEEYLEIPTDSIPPNRARNIRIWDRALAEEEVESL